MPVEPSDAVCVPAFVTTARVPESVDVEVGLNCTVTAQVALTASVVAQVVATKLKPVPVTDEAVGTVTVKGPAPVLVNVAVAVLDEPTGVAAKLGVDSVACGAIPVPESVTACVPAPVVKLSEPVRAPPVEAVKSSVTVQLPLTATDVPHVVETKLKSVPETEAALGTVNVNVPTPVLLKVAVASWPLLSPL